MFEKFSIEDLRNTRIRIGILKNSIETIIKTKIKSSQFKPRGVSKYNKRIGIDLPPLPSSHASS